MMKVVVTTAAIRRAKLQSSHHHQQTNIQHFTGRMPFLCPNSTEGKQEYGSNFTMHCVSPPGTCSMKILKKSSSLTEPR